MKTRSLLQQLASPGHIPAALCLLVLTSAGCGDEGASARHALTQEARSAQGSGPTDLWSEVAPLSAPRTLHTMTLLQDGTPFVVGGLRTDTFDWLDTTETFDPTTDTWTPRASLPYPFSGHEAVLLTDGRVLVSGNVDDVAQIYDPAADAWSATTFMIFTGGTATLLEDGTVLVAGGFFDFDENLSFSVYDPQTNALLHTAPLPNGWNNATATRLADGRVLMAGGWRWDYSSMDGEQQVTLADAALFDPVTRTWTATAPMHLARLGHSAVLLGDGRVLVTGGDFGTGTDSAELYDPAAGTWTQTTPMHTARANHTITLLPSGRAVVAGGYNSQGVDSVEAYDASTDTWTELSPLNVPRLNHRAVLVPGAGLLLAGGKSGGLFDDGLSSVEIHPFGQGILGSTCAIGDECESAFCHGDVCVDSLPGTGGAGGAGGGGGDEGVGGTGQGGAGGQPGNPTSGAGGSSNDDGGCQLAAGAGTSATGLSGWLAMAGMAWLASRRRRQR
ncbi:Kelch repeat-containing protein [Chondromyces crocatus]|uniref:Uncharacterized protein n=1 Tax=Chondromyces crocatus TaxID=52 RepID=A0A0K1E9Y6_CHOCO|nr:kelch repeat-containing protein [Chondromyces crocatus]AKT37497.1 uncharacterized protein CMC5_016380 [Chondromyces crocatus]